MRFVVFDFVAVVDFVGDRVGFGFDFVGFVAVDRFVFGFGEFGENRAHLVNAKVTTLSGFGFGFGFVNFDDQVGSQAEFGKTFVSFAFANAAVADFVVFFAVAENALP